MKQVDFYQVNRYVVFLLIIALSSCVDLVSCENRIIKEIEINESVKAFLIERDCGATTNISTFIWIGEKPKKFDIKSENVVFLYEGKSDLVEVVAESRVLTVSHDLDPKCQFIKKVQFDSINVLYQ